MAPPVQSASVGSTQGGNGAAAAAQSVFNWKDVPVNQHIQITRAVFDQGGYQLYANTGETIVVPFTDQNLYVMRFGQTIGGNMFFVNDGTTPTLYMPQSAYLENTAADGAKWYPFPQNYDYNGPVYEGIAPSWDAYCDMGWYPGMACYGGYWGYTPFGFGVGFYPMPGFCFSIFGASYFGWGAYHGYYGGHPYGRFGFHDGGFHGYGVGRRGPGAFAAHAGFSHGANGFGGRAAAGAHAFGSTSGGGRTASGGRSFGSQGAFSGGHGVSAFGSRSFGNSRPFSGGSVGGRSQGAFGGGRAFSGGSSFGGGRSFSGGSFGGGRSFSGGNSFGGGRSVSGGSFGGGRSVGGGGSFGGGHSFGGGGSFGGGHSGGGGGHR